MVQPSPHFSRLSRWDAAKKRWFFLYCCLTVGVLWIVAKDLTQAWFPEPWRALSDVDAWWIGIGTVACVAGPVLMGLTVHPYKTTHWKRDFTVVLALQCSLVGLLIHLVESSRPRVVALVSGDWVFASKEALPDVKGQAFQKVVVVPTKENVKHGWEGNRASWVPASKEALQKGAKWSVLKLDTGWSSGEFKEKWAEFKAKHPNWKNMAPYPVYGMSQSAWWFWDLESGTPIEVLYIPAPLDHVSSKAPSN